MLSRSVETCAKTALEALEQNGLKRRLRRTSGPQGREMFVDGKKVLNFCSNNYLGLADDPRLMQAAVECMKEEGFGAGASRLVCGNMPAHRRLEKAIAEFKGTESCLLFSSGYMANVGIIASLFGREDIVFSDRLNHASIIDGIQLSRARCCRYPHRDMAALEQSLRTAGSFRRRGIITDSVFSMDGDIAPLDEIVALADRYDCLVMIDDAHALGVLGEKGRGAAEHFGLESRIDVRMGTLSKAAGSFGAYCCGSQGLIDLLINKARSFIYTTAMPPAVAAASLRAIEIIRDEPGRREQLWRNARVLDQELRRMGFDTMDTQTPIIPVLVRDPARTVEFSEQLLDRGILVAAIRPPTVPPNMARLRLTAMATHTRDDLDFVCQQFKETGKRLCLI